MNAIMTMSNIVDPSSRICQSPARGKILGNRGLLHNEDKKIIRNYRSESWVTCIVDKYTKKEPIHKALNTELFFIDEATAFSAGHRPCDKCKKERFDNFLNSWLRGNKSVFTKIPKNIKTIDRIIHKQRIRNNKQVTYLCLFNLLPKGTFIQIEEDSYIVWNKDIFRWTQAGYKKATIETPTNKEVIVRTPKSFVNMYDAGFEPQVHESLFKLI